jgi:hypothetical protein
MKQNEQVPPMSATSAARVSSALIEVLRELPFRLKDRHTNAQLEQMVRDDCAPLIGAVVTDRAIARG